MKKPGYRHEIKYYRNEGEYMLLSQRLRKTMSADENANEYGEYRIRSLYFDDPEDSAMRDKLSGFDGRSKVRLRIYSLSDEVIKLERKNKDNGYILKESIGLSREECGALLGGSYGFLISRPEEFAHERYAEFRLRRLKPAVIVDYVREAYVFPVEDVRITFDKDIRTAHRSADLFNRDLPTYPVIDGYDMVLEVKYNKYLPSYIRGLIQTGAADRSAISKYVFCRKYEL